MRGAIVLGLVAALVGAATATSASGSAAGDVRSLVEGYERSHPSPYASVSKSRLRRETNALATRAPRLGRAQLVVGLMRLVALAGPRNGHTAIYPYDQHPRPLRVYPIRVYAFPTGLHVVAAPGREALVGARLTTIDGAPIDRVVAAVRPLVPRDNPATVLDLLPEYVLTEEVLVGLGLTDGGEARLEFADGRSETFAPVAAPSFAAIGSILAPLRRPGATQPIWLRFPERTQYLATIARGTAVYLGYHLTTDETYTVSRRLLALASRPSVRSMIVDARLNHGGDNTTYGALLGAMQQLSRTRSVSLLVGRATFSAAGNFAADVDALPRVRVVGEDTGGAPSQWGDSTTIELPFTGLIARVATSYQRYGDRKALTTRPSHPVQLTIEDFVAGRDPVLRRALALR